MRRYSKHTVEDDGGWNPDKFKGHYAQELLDELYVMSTAMQNMKLKSMPHMGYRVGRHNVPLHPDFPSTFQALRDKLQDPAFIRDHVQNVGGESSTRSHESLLDVLDYLVGAHLQLITPHRPFRSQLSAAHFISSQLSTQLSSAPQLSNLISAAQLSSAPLSSHQETAQQETAQL